MNNNIISNPGPYGKTDFLKKTMHQPIIMVKYTGTCYRSNYKKGVAICYWIENTKFLPRSTGRSI